jgi:tRNA 2-selenouridine synthase SelU
LIQLISKHDLEDLFGRLLKSFENQFDLENMTKEIIFKLKQRINEEICEILL